MGRREREPQDVRTSSVVFESFCLCCSYDSASRGDHCSPPSCGHGNAARTLHRRPQHTSYESELSRVWIQGRL